MTTHGADVSHYQTVTDYGAVRGALDWLSIKVTEGADIVDAKWRQHYNGFAPKPRLPYHFMRGSSAAEVANFVAQWKSVPWECDVMLDAEYPGVTVQAIKAWIDEYRRQSGQRHLFVYCSKSFLAANDLSVFLDADITIWAARYYANSPDFSTLGWDHPQLGIYQYWNAGSVPGFSGAVDLDVARVPVTKGATTVATGDINYDQQLPVGPPAVPTPGPWPTKKLGDIINDTRNAAMAAQSGVTGLTAQLAGIQASIAAIAANPAITPDQIAAAIDAAVAAHLKVTIDVTPTPAP